MFWKYGNMSYFHTADFCYFFPKDIQGNRKLVRLMVLEQPSAILEEHWLWTLW